MAGRLRLLSRLYEGNQDLEYCFEGVAFPGIVGNAAEGSILCTAIKSAHSSTGDEDQSATQPKACVVCGEWSKRACEVKNHFEGSL